MNQNESFSDDDARAAWNEGAEAWEAFVESGDDYYRHEVHGPALLAACEPVDGLAVLDLGCGQGYFSRLLARRGAQVIGIDIADQAIAYARQHEPRPSEEQVRRRPQLLDCYRLPYFLIFDLIKQK